MDKLKFEEYKFVAASTQLVTDRRQAATQTYLMLNVAILAVSGAIVQSTRIADPYILVPAVPLFTVGILVCLVWQRILADYRALISWRYDQLMEVERTEALAGCHQLYVKEWQDFFRSRQVKGSFNAGPRACGRSGSRPPAAGGRGVKYSSCGGLWPPAYWMKDTHTRPAAMVA